MSKLFVINSNEIECFNSQAFFFSNIYGNGNNVDGTDIEKVI